MYKPYKLAQVGFKRLEEIGEDGKNSKVYLSHDPQLNAKIVIKEIEKSKFTNLDDHFIESAMLYESAHTNVVPIHYACYDADNIFLAMPFFANGSLKNLLNSRHPSVREIIVLSTQFLTGLHHIHSKRLIHFDIKPDNILISDNGEAMLSDFGLTRRMQYDGVAQQNRIYTKISPPEAFTGNVFSNKFDVYQSGVTLYRMCVGERSFYAQFEQFLIEGVLNLPSFKKAILSEEFPNRTTYPEHIPLAMRNVIRDCLKSDPDSRLDSAISIVNRLSDIDGHCLDWNYSVGSDYKQWKKETEDKSVTLKVSDSGNSLAWHTSKTGRRRRIPDFCQESISKRGIKEMLRRH